jgi:uncharacterized protein YbjT (DUF2867 family)
MGIQRYIFFSIHNCDRHPEVPLMLIKSCTEKYLETSGLNFTTFRMCGFMQVGDHVSGKSDHLASAAACSLVAGADPVVMIVMSITGPCS